MSTQSGPDWNERYKDAEFAYGKEPNVFFKEWLLKFTPGSILMPADGEGRNGVFAAQQGWRVTSFDQSSEAKIKALQLAGAHAVNIEYLVGDFEQLHFKKESFDAIGLVYAHFSADQKATYHKKLNECLKPGGVIIFEAFSKQHIDLVRLDPRVGGPKDIDVLYSKDELQADFSNYEIVKLKEEEVFLSEGKYHNGKGSVVRFVGRKK